MKGEKRMREYRKRWETGQRILYKAFRTYLPVEHEIPFIVNGIVRKGLREVEALDIGGGEGSASLQVIEGLQKVGVKVTRWDSIDVSKEQVNSFREKISGVRGPKFNFWLQGWNEFFPPKQYDFVLVRHSWYGVNEWREEPRETNALMKLYKAIKKEGIAVMVLSPRDDVLFAVPNPFQGDTTSEDVCEALERIGVKFHCEGVKRPLPALLEGGELIEAGEGVFRYMLYSEDISLQKVGIEQCLSKWFERHREWFSQSIFIWID